MKISRAKKNKKNPAFVATMVRDGRKVPPETEAEIERLYLGDRLGLRAVAERVGWGEGAVLKVLKRRGVPRRNPAEGRWLSERRVA
jgi:hypothetical protein